MQQHVFQDFISNIRLFLVVFCFLSLPSPVDAQWVQTSGPEGGEAKSIAYVGDEIWMTTEYGVYTSANEGASWNIHPLFTNVYAEDILATGDSILVTYATSVSFGSTLYGKRSFDGGNTWSAPIAICDYDSYFEATLKKVRNTIYYVGVWPDDIVSTDFGASWTEFSFPYYAYPYFETFGPNSFIVTYFNTANSRYYYYLRDEVQQTWAVLDTVHRIQALLDGVMIKDEFVFCVISSEQNGETYSSLIRTNDVGATWDTIVSHPQDDFVQPRLFQFNGAFYLNYITLPGHEIHWLRSDDNGESWISGDFPSFLHSGTEYLALSTSEALLATSTGLSRHNLSGAGSFPVNTGFKAQKTNLYEHNGKLFSSSTYANFVSEDGGATWNRLPFLFYGTKAYLFRGDTILTTDGGNLFRSFDNAFTWDTIALSIINSFQEHTIEELNQRIYLTGNDSIHFSDDYGLSWQGIAPWLNVDGYATNGGLKRFGNELFCISNDGSIAQLNAQTNEWTRLIDFFSPGAGNGNELYAVDEKLIASGRMFFKCSTDGGLTWTTPALSGLPLNSTGDPYSPRDVISYDGLWFCTMGSYGVYYSSDQGESWQQIQNPSPFVAYGGLALLNNTLFSGSFNSSVWRRTGPMTTISGSVYRDFDNDGLMNGSDYYLPGVLLKTSPQTFTSSTNTSGNYSLYTDVIGDSLKPVLPSTQCVSNPNLYVVTGEAIEQNFGIYVDSAVNDLNLDLSNASVFRPGFETSLTLELQNLGGSDASPLVKLLLDPALTFLSAMPEHDQVIGDTLIWNLSALSFFESTRIDLLVYNPINTPLGDTVRCYASVWPTADDITPTDNSTSLIDVVVGSYDPNDKTCLNGDFITLSQAQTDELQFIVRFQNTGNYPADYVHIADTLSNFLDMGTFRIISSSHDMRYSIGGAGTADFYFDNINLADSASNEAQSHGFVKYGIMCKPNIQLGNAILNTAFIYFDFNPAIITNTTTTLVSFPIILSNDGPVQDKVIEKAILVYPNPANAYFTVDTRGIDSGNLTLSLFDIRGARVKSERISSLQTISLEDLSSGVYIGVISGETGQIARSFKLIHQ